MDEILEMLEQMRRDIDRVRSRRAMWMGLLRGIVSAAMVVFLPTPWSTAVVAGLLSSVAASLWMVRPRRCSICGERIAMPVPREPLGPSQSQNWRNLMRFRSNLIWICVKDLPVLVHRLAMTTPGAPSEPGAPAVPRPRADPRRPPDA